MTPRIAQAPKPRKPPMAAEAAVPVARLKKLWRRFRQRRGLLRSASHKNPSRDARLSLLGQCVGLVDAAADLRAVIDEAKGETR